MLPASQPIHIKVLLGDEKHDLVTYKGEYRSLMALLFDRLSPEDFGECRGVGRCGTCLIEIIEGNSTLEAYDRNEEITIARLEQDITGCRLSCQIPIDNNLSGVKIKIR